MLYRFSSRDDGRAKSGGGREASNGLLVGIERESLGACLGKARDVLKRGNLRSPEVGAMSRSVFDNANMTLEERHAHYVPLRRECDNPETTFAANRGKWTAPVVIQKRSIISGSLHKNTVGLSGSNPNNWRKCKNAGCEVMVWHNQFFCKEHKPKNSGHKNPANWKTCQHPGCKNLLYKNNSRKFCSLHR